MTDETNDTTTVGEAELDVNEELEPAAIDEELGLEPGPEPEPEPAEPDDAPSSQALLAALEKEERRHKKAIAGALGVELEALHDCPTCQAVGYTPEPIDSPPALVQDPYTEACSRCAGNGEVLSGATARALYTIPCNGCGGSGYVTKPEQPDAGATFGSSSGGSGTVQWLPPASPADQAELAALRAKGYTILDPITVPPPSQS